MNPFVFFVDHVLSLLQVDQALQVASSDLPIQMQRGARQTNCAKGLAAHLRQASSEHLNDSSTRTGDAVVAPLLDVRNRVFLLPLPFLKMFIIISDSSDCLVWKFVSFWIHQQLAGFRQGDINED